MSDLATLREGRQVSPEFLAAHKQRRIIDALAELTVENGYSKATVADIVRRAGIARNTFYENFKSKADAGASLAHWTFPTLSQLAPSGHSGYDLFLIDRAAAKRTGAEMQSGDLVDALSRLLDAPGPSAADASLLQTLPPGRHGLDQGFVTANQRRRVLLGFAAAVTDKGFPAVSIADVTREARISRRTFYEHYSGCAEVASALLDQAPDFVPNVDPETGEGALAVEAAAYWFTGILGPAAELVGFAREVVNAAAPAEMARAA